MCLCFQPSTKATDSLHEKVPEHMPQQSKFCVKTRLASHSQFKVRELIRSHGILLCFVVTAVVGYLLENDNKDTECVMSVSEYVKLYDTPYDVVLESGK